MKRDAIFHTVLCVLMGLTAVPSQAQTGGVRVNVPFNFEVANKTLPEGEYLMWSAKDNVFIQSSQGRTVAVVLSNAVSGRSVGKTGQVVFQCYGHHCFLSEFWSPTQYAGRQLPKSRREEELAKRQTAQYFAFAGAPHNHQR